MSATRLLRRGPGGAATAALAAAVLLVAGCGDSGSKSSDTGSATDGAAPAGPREVQTTRVQVVEDIGKSGAFDPREIYTRLSPGVVTVIALSGGKSPLGGPQGGQGSGFVLDGQGYLATNAHVVTTGTGTNLKPAKQVYASFADDNRVPARIVGFDPNADVALLKIDPAGLRLTPLPLGESSRLRVGAPVAAIGSPFGEEQSLSIGVISALNRNIESLTAFGIGHAIQTDAAINKGNSGGPLIDSHGRVIGINAQIKTESGDGSGVGFAVPVDIIKRSLHDLRATGRVAYGYLGVSSQSLYPQLARRLGIGAPRGALIVNVQGGSPADHAGLSSGSGKIGFQGQQDIPRGGDVIVAVDGRPVSGSDDLADVIALKRPGETVTLRVVRGRRFRTVRVKLAPRPNKAPKDARQP